MCRETACRDEEREAFPMKAIKEWLARAAGCPGNAPSRAALEADLADALSRVARAREIVHELGNMLVPLLLLSPVVAPAIADEEAQRVFAQMVSSATRSRDLVQRLGALLRGEDAGAPTGEG
jgi:hypothetical protein